MRKRTRFRSLALDAAVALVCLLSAAFFLWLFWRDLNSYTADRSDKLRAGVISFKRNVAQRKFSDRVVWERVPQSAVLYDLDTIRTADAARATITFDDGTVLDLFERTMVQVHYDPARGLRLDVDGGDVRVDSAASDGAVDVRLDDGTTVSLDRGTSLSASSAAASGGVSVSGGSAKVVTASGETASLSAGEGVSVDEGVISRLPVTVLHPPRELRIPGPPGGSVPVRFEWRTEAADDVPVVVQMSRGRDGSEPFLSEEIPGSTTSAEFAADGVVYWRVSAGGGAEGAASGRIEVVPAEPVAALSPADGSGFPFRSSPPRIPFRWTESPLAERYRLVVSATEDMASIVAERVLEGTGVSLDSLSEGEYFWQVTPLLPLGGDGRAEASPVSSFTVERVEGVRPPEPTLPPEGAEIRRAGGVARLAFAWRSDVPDADYAVVVSADPRISALSSVPDSAPASLSDVPLGDGTSLSAIVLRSSATRVSGDFSGGGLPDGTLFWRVVRNSRGAEDPSPISAVRSFTVSPPAPEGLRALYPPDGFGVEEGLLGSTEFRWAGEGGGEVLLQFKADVPSAADGTSGGELREFPAEGGSASVTGLPAGTWWWRVAGVDGAEASEARSLTVLPSLGAPSAISPADGEELVLRDGEGARLSWTAVDGADRYSVSVSGAGGSSVWRGAVPGTSASPALPAGSYTVRVQAEADGGAFGPRAGRASSWSFSVRGAEPISLLSPSDGEEVDGLTALRRPTSFSWDEGRDSAGGVTFTLTRIDGRKARVVERVEGAPMPVRVARLRSGRYSWRVDGVSRGGIPLGSGERGLVVGEVEPLPPAVLSEPSDGAVLGPDFFRRNRSLPFSWGAVQGATAYSFTLRRSGGGVVRAERNVRGTAFVFGDLSSLDVGEFEWEVVPLALASDGFEERRGAAARGSFRIQFDQPTRVEGVSPGRMYGD